MSKNPVQKLPKDGSVKAPVDDMVTDHRLALLECDELPIEEQWNKLIRMRLPVVSVIFSGNKSLHILCRVDAGQDHELYKKRVAALYQYAADHGLTPDQACKNSSRLTRCPGFKRGDKLQYLVSGPWGYADWQSFEKSELQSISQNSMPSQEEQLISELSKLYDPPFSYYESKDGIESINQNFFAHYVLRTRKLVNEGGLFWEYDNETGLWKQI